MALQAVLWGLCFYSKLSFCPTLEITDTSSKLLHSLSTSFCSWSQASCSKSWYLPLKISLLPLIVKRLRECLRIHATFPQYFSGSKDSKPVFFLPRFSAWGNEMGNKEGRSFQIVSKEPEVVGGLHLKLPSPTTRVDLTSKASPLLQFSLGLLFQELRLPHGEDGELWSI